jgi:hypothetical protein
MQEWDSIPSYQAVFGGIGFSLDLLFAQIQWCPSSPISYPSEGRGTTPLLQKEVVMFVLLQKFRALRTGQKGLR